MAKATSDSAVARRKLSVIIVALILSLCTSQADANFTVWVRRRSTGDLYRLNSTDGHEICDPSASYLIDEKQYAMDEELFNGCGVAIVPIESTSLIPTAAAIDSQYSAIITIDDSFKKHVLIFGFNGTNQSVNSSFCQISSLEVYRGREQAIEISHQGFSLSDNGSIQIHDHQLAYGTDDYTGELYRMNLSCSGGGLPECGCLFFKVVGNTSTIIDKFNNTVLGTLTVSAQSDNAITVSDSMITSTKIMTTFSTTVTTHAIMPSPDTVYIAVGGVLFFLIVTAVLGVVAGLLVRRVKHNVATKQLSQMTSHDYQRNPAYGRFGPTDSSPAALNYSENPAYNIDAQPSAPQEPTYEVIPSEIDRIPQEAQSVTCSQNPAYIHLGVSVEESFQAATDDDYSQNPAYGIHSNPN